MKTLSRDEILSADDLPREFVPCPEWANGDNESGVIVRTLTAGERDRLEAHVLANQNKETINVRALIALMCCVDDEGKNIFKPSDLAEVASKSVKPLDRILAVAQGLNHFSDDDIEQLEKNSEAVQLEGSSFDLL